MECLFNFFKGIFEKINWLDDIVSAVISTFLAIIISRHYYIKSNRDLFCNEVLSEIVNTCSPQDTRNVINEQRNRWIYGVSGMDNYREKILRLDDACKNTINNSYKKAFSDAILNYFFKKIGVERFHKQYIEETGEFIEDSYPDEPRWQLERYAIYDPENFDYINECQNCIIEILKEYYKMTISKGVDKNIIKAINMLFFEKTMDQIVKESEEYKVAKQYEDEYLKRLNDIKSMVTNN